MPDDRMLFAQAHLELHPRVAAQHFDCAVGARFSAAPRPSLTAVFERLAREVGPEARDAGAHGEVCVRLRPGEAGPQRASRRAALAGAYAEALKRAAPDRAARIDLRARDLVASEILCGLSDRESSARGLVAGQVAFGRLAIDPEFAALLGRAAVEVAEARLDPLESPACAAERRVLSALPDAD